MKRLGVSLGVLSLLGLSFYVWSQQIDPGRRAGQIEMKRQQRIMDALKPNAKISIEQIDRDAMAEAKHDLKGVDSARIPADSAFEWSKLYRIAREFATERELIERYRATNPPDAFTVDLAYMMSCVDLKDGRSLAAKLHEVKLSSDPERWTLASLLGGTYHFTLRNSLGLERTIALIDEMDKKFPKPPFQSEEARKSCGWARRQLADAKAQYLVELGRVKDAIAVLDNAMATLDKDVYRFEELASVKRRYEMISRPVPALPEIRSHGSYSGLDTLKGKVVILDFTAHWCHPCLASLPYLAKLYADLHPKGLEILSVTQFYGHFQAENFEKKDMPRQVEFDRMPALMKKYGVSWSMVYVEPQVFKSFSVAGIPQVMLLNRKGKLLDIDLGFSPEKFDRLRKRVEIALSRPD